MHIRPEQPSDFDAIDEVVAAAFGQDDEAALVRAIRASDAYVNELSLVAIDDQELLGHIMLSYVSLGPHRVLQLAPLAVRPDKQNVGIGIALTNSALERADLKGEPLVLVLGHPSYYPRFGFSSARALGIDPPDPAWDEAFMAKRLRSYTEDVRGRLVLSPAFDGSSPNEPAK